MRINNQAKVGIVTIICLLTQGYIFTHVLGVQPNPVISFVPLLPYLAYIYAGKAEPGILISRFTGSQLS